MENNKNKKSVKFQGDMLNFCDFIQVFVFTTNHHLKVIFKAEFIKILEYSIYVNECWIIFTVLHSGLSLFRWKIVEIKVSGNFPTWRRDARMFINNLCFPSKSGSSDGFPQVEI